MSEYIPPGAYIGQLIRPVSASVTGFPRLPCFVAKGSRLARATNSPITRAKVFDEELEFTGVGPHSALLAHQANGNKVVTELLVDGARVPDNHYTFATTTVANDTIRIPGAYFQASGTYVITYQSVDRSVLDPIPFEDLRQVDRVARSTGGNDFLESVNFIIPVTASAPVADDGNAEATSESTAFGVTNGALAVVTIAGPSSENIILTGTDRFGFLVNVVSGGSESLTENISTRTLTLTYVTTVSTQTSLIATITTALTGLTLVGAVTAGTGVTAWVSPTQTQLKMGTALDIGGGNTGDGQVSLASTAEYTHPYTRDYTIRCVTGGDSATAVFAWSSTPNSLGNTVAHHNPHPDQVLVTSFRNNITNPGDFVAVALEYGLQVVVHDQAGTFDVGDVWTFRALGNSLIEVDLRHSATNQFALISSVAAMGTPSGLGVLAVASNSAQYTGTFNRSYKLTVSAVATTPNRATFKWTAVGDDGIATGTTAALANDATALLDNGVTIAVDLDAGNFAVADTYIFTVKAPRVVPTIKDDRSYTAEVDVALTGDVSFVYFTDTPEGGIGEFTATNADSHVELPGNLSIHVRNLVGPRYTASDSFTWAVTIDDLIDWSLQTRVAETIPVNRIIHDLLGRVTGTPDTYYLVLTNAPDTIISIVNTVPAAVTGTVVTAGGANTRYVNLGATAPTTAITVTYQHRGKEPNPGDTYFFSALYLRGDELYNKPILVTDEAAGIALSEPLGRDNHMAIINGIAWDYDPVGIYLCQVKDADDDGVYQDSDYETAIESTEVFSGITDVVVLDAWGTLAKQLEHIDRMADPLLNKQRLLWLGAPTDTVIGDVNTSGSLVHTAVVTTAVAGDSQSHGTRIMVAPTWAKRTVVIDRITTVLDLDGSFVAAAFCLQYASFRNPSFTALRKNVTVFKEIQEYDEGEILRLGAAQVVYLKRLGDGVYQWGEDFTTDPIGTENAPEEFQIISAMIQKRYINRRIQAAVDAAVIALVPDSPEAGLAVLRNTIKTVLQEDVNNKNIGEYQNEDGNTRRLNPSTDILVYRDRLRSTIYRFLVAYFLKYPVKKAFGLALTDSNNFGVNASGTAD